MYDVNLRFANKWILTFAFHVEAMSAKVDWIWVFAWRCYMTLLRHGFGGGSFASHCLRGISAPLRSIFLIWNMSSIHYEEWSRRLGYMQLRIRWTLCETTACQWPIHSAAAAFCYGERVSALFFSNLGLLGVALGIATGIVVDGCDLTSPLIQPQCQELCNG